MTRYPSFLLLCLALFAPVVLGAEQAGLNDGLSEVSALIGKKNYSAAETKLAALAAQYPDNRQLAALRGVVLSELGPDRAPEAIKLLEPAAEIYAETAAYRTALCRSYIKLGGNSNAGKAVDNCKKSLALDSRNADTTLLLAQAYGAKNDYKTALGYFQQVKKFRPDDYRVLYGTGKGYLAKGLPKKALGELTLAHHKAALPSWNATLREQADIEIALGDAYAELGNRTAALQSYDAAVETLPAPEISDLVAARVKKIPGRRKRENVLAALDRHDREREKERNALPAGERLAAAVPVRLTDAQKAEFKACVREAERLFSAKDNTGSEAQYRKCLVIQPGDANARISLAGVLLLLEKLEDAAREFERGVRLLPPDSPMIGYCRSRQGDIELKRNRPEKAADYYRQAVAIDPAEVNAWVGLGRYHEEKREWGDAYASYNSGLGLEPANPAASAGLRRVEPYVATDTEVLAELKLRRVLPQTAVGVTLQDRDTFRRMRKYEGMRAIDYLEHRMKKMPAAYTVTKGEKAPEFRLLFSLDGYNAYLKLITSDMVSKLEKSGIVPRAIFTVTDKFGDPVFSETGIITDAGMDVFYASLLGEKAYYLPREKVPQAVLDALSSDEKTKLKYKRKGFDLITGSEVQWLTDMSRCPLETMVTDLSLVAEQDSNGDGMYFLPKTGGKGNGMLQNLVTRYRAGDTRLLKKAGPEVTPIQTPIPLDYEAICGPDGKVKTLITDFDSSSEAGPLLPAPVPAAAEPEEEPYASGGLDNPEAPAVPSPAPAPVQSSTAPVTPVKFENTIK